MNKKIIIIVVVSFVFLSSIFSSTVFASEISGTLSSNGLLTQGQTTSGTIIGSVISSTLSSNTVVAYRGGRGYIPAAVTKVVSDIPVLDNSTNGISSDRSAFVAFAAGPSQVADGGFTTSSSDSESVSTTTSDQTVQASLDASNSDSASLLAAQAGSGISISNEIAWIIFILLIAIIAGFIFYRKYKNDHKKVSYDRLSN